ncbi:hypothetical protein GCK32_022668, partial [Trichostrongylus colubriformis]
MNQVYGSPLRPDTALQPRDTGARSNTSIRLRGNVLRLRDDQARALRMGMEDRPILAIQAAFGTGKTVVAALIAARLSSTERILVATATTNVAVAQLTDTLLGLDEFRSRLSVLRFVADTAIREGAPTTPVDLHPILLGLAANPTDTLTEREIARLRRYARGRSLIERVLRDPNAAFGMTEEEREEYRIAEYDNSDATEEAVAIMLKVRFPTILCMTVSALLNSTRPG